MWYCSGTVTRGFVLWRNGVVWFGAVKVSQSRGTVVAGQGEARYCRGIVNAIFQQYCDVLQCIGGVGSSVGMVQCRAVRVE